CAKRIISLLSESEKNIEIRVNGALTGDAANLLI
ncbi:YscQ/HrcQ family type III secretion apparatus protein, partial [Escherichia coli]|nr:YscQ/HrcQ family type III secretion apparatus protein [Escherichia coli]